MELTFGTSQIFTSERMKSKPKLARLFKSVFGYTNVGNYARFTIFKKLMKHIDLPQNAKILDLGAGYGEYSFSLAKALPKAKIHSLDVDKERIATLNEAIKASGTNNITTHCTYTEQLEEREFDFIFSIDVFEHITPKEMPFKAAYDRLKPGGYFMVKIPNKHQRTLLPERYFEEHHEWLEEEHVGQVYNLEDLWKRFIGEGFRVVHGSYSDGWFSRLGWEAAYLGKKAGLLGQILSLPFAKLCIKIDRLVHGNSWGNAIQVIGIKEPSCQP
ncbi:SAM-dependent methyltransferase [Roseivirga thermotolerans]|jgi:ubiquinone/menaquinone biosynthesis C-methylase UbiE|uniref:Methyltransferase domain-containing protein n=1 Tax=Roseivirga thermotolerans TaxID=1758176 RepID=A0ABQ3IBI8_9BACT|nr:class I SAM-dependent methyltransferase [Roseivirga thermotolerans]MEC7755401.1 class I SAM-dependent methyltransferase [Bacteroidota bacterium]GHE73408.1 hypothetical protein GCM10011340_32520 [Roseivirga thermotolerans]